MQKLVYLVVVALCLTGLSARAGTLAGVTLPDTYDFNGQRLVLNGMGLRSLTILNVRVYVAGLYLAQPSHDPEQILRSATPKVLVLQFLHAGTKEQIERQYRAGQAQNCGRGSVIRPIGRIMTR